MLKCYPGGHYYRRNRRAIIIIEAKKSDKESDLEIDCNKAIKLIIDEKYAEGIDGYEQILFYGVVRVG